jgi:hypothetical protein
MYIVTAIRMNCFNPSKTCCETFGPFIDEQARDAFATRLSELAPAWLTVASRTQFVMSGSLLVNDVASYLNNLEE